MNSASPRKLHFWIGPSSSSSSLHLTAIPIVPQSPQSSLSLSFSSFSLLLHNLHSATSYVPACNAYMDHCLSFGMVLMKIWTLFLLLQLEDFVFASMDQCEKPYSFPLLCCNELRFQSLYREDLCQFLFRGNITCKPLFDISFYFSVFWEFDKWNKSITSKKIVLDKIRSQKPVHFHVTMVCLAWKVLFFICQTYMNTKKKFLFLIKIFLFSL